MRCSPDCLRPSRQSPSGPLIAGGFLEPVEVPVLMLYKLCKGVYEKDERGYIPSKDS
jgi:hypothetical protein